VGHDRVVRARKSRGEANIGQRIEGAFALKLCGQGMTGHQASLLASGRHDARIYAALWQSLKEAGHWQGEIWKRRKNGEVFPDGLRISVVKDPQGAQLLPDLDRFKLLNDTDGHDLGDLLLQQVAQRLLACVREVDTVARIGGDAFVVTLAQLSDDLPDATKRARSVSEKILAALSQAYDLSGSAWRSTVSIGIAMLVNHQQSSEEILKAAHQAMYLAKAGGRNTVHLADRCVESGAGQAPGSSGLLSLAWGRRRQGW